MIDRRTALGKEAQPLQADPMVELLITRALRLAHDDVDLQLAARELIRASGHDVAVLQSAHAEATTRFPEFGAGVWIGEAFAPLFAAIVSLEEEQLPGNSRADRHPAPPQIEVPKRPLRFDLGAQLAYEGGGTSRSQMVAARPPDSAAGSVYYRA